MTRRLALSALAFALSASTAFADPPKVGDAMPLVAIGPGKPVWSMGAPNANDAAGKVVIHWFCTPKVSACTDDLARLVTLRENGGVYIVAYINGTGAAAKKLDPIRESEGVGRGTMLTGPVAKGMFKDYGIQKGPASIVVDVDGKVKAVTTSGDINELDARDTVVKQLVEAVKPYTTTNEGSANGNPSSKLTFAIHVTLAPWLTYSKKSPMEFQFSGAKEIKCDATKLTGDQLKVDAQNTKRLTALVTCTAPKGSYQARGDLRFGYESPTGAQGLGAETATWKFEIKP